jgi:hypothetical protein
LLADGDNELPVDLDNVLSVETFVELVKDREQASLVELPGPGQLYARGPEGRFVHELVIPFVRVPEAAGPARDGAAGTREPSPRLRPGRAPCRRFPPGSAWLYAKLYTGPATADQVLQEVVRPVTAAALTAGAADRWFFIRYGDPDWHLRWPRPATPRTTCSQSGWPWKRQSTTPSSTATATTRVSGCEFLTA